MHIFTRLQFKYAIIAEIIDLKVLKFVESIGRFSRNTAAHH